MELQNWAGAMHCNMLKALELAEAKEGRMTRRNESRSGGRLRRDGQTSVPASPGVHERRGKALRLQSGEIWVQGVEANGQSLPPKNRCRSFAWLTHPVSASGLTSTRPRILQNARSTMPMQAWEQEVAEFEGMYAKRIDEDAKILALKSIMFVRG